MPGIATNRCKRDTSSLRGVIAGGFDRGDERRYWTLLGVVYDLGACGREIDLDGRHTAHLSQRRIDVLHAAVARHPGDLQGGDHEATVA